MHVLIPCDRHLKDSSHNTNTIIKTTSKRSRTSQRVRNTRILKREKASQTENNKILTGITNKYNNIIKTCKNHAQSYYKSKLNIAADPNEQFWHNKQQKCSKMTLPKCHQKLESKGCHDLTDTVKPPECLSYLS